MAKAKAKTEVQEYDWSQEASTGFEGTKTEDLGIPFLQIVQAKSPEFDETHDDYAKKFIEGVRPGYIINSLSRQVAYSGDRKNPLKVIPCFAEKMYPEFKSRKDNGGFVKMHRDPTILSSCERNEKNKDVIMHGNGQGHEIITTHYFYLMAEIDGVWEKVILGMTSTQLKNARRWLNLMSSIKINGNTPPMFSHIYGLTTDVEKNQEGTWYGWNATTIGALNPNAGDDRELVVAARGVAVDMVKNLALPAPGRNE
jgi:hypothetical protein